MTLPKLKIDENPELPLAIIEDTEDGMGVCEEVVSKEYAGEIVRRFNTFPELLVALEDAYKMIYRIEREPEYFDTDECFLRRDKISDVLLAASK